MLLIFDNFRRPPLVVGRRKLSHYTKKIGLETLCKTLHSEFGFKVLGRVFFDLKV